jgi:hypothetical protein
MMGDYFLERRLSRKRAFFLLLRSSDVWGLLTKEAI